MSRNMTPSKIHGVDCLLHPDKALYFVDDHILLISDLHLGKGQHFRKHGVAVPLGLMETNFTRLDSLCDLLQPEEIIFLGDLFHSVENRAVDRFAAFRQNVTSPCTLILGNHDIINHQVYESLQLECTVQREYKGMLLVHDQEEFKDSELPVVSGHIHPAVKLRAGRGPSLRLPAFILGERRSVMPAFGAFTGMHTIKTVDTDQVFAIADDEVVHIARD